MRSIVVISVSSFYAHFKAVFQKSISLWMYFVKSISQATLSTNEHYILKI